MSINNIIYSASINEPLKDCQNYNTLVIGQPGSGKTYSYFMPNLAQMLCSYVVIDTKGKLYNEFKDKLESNGYDVKLIDFEHPGKTVHYNPLSFIKCENDVRTLASILSDYKRTSSVCNDIFWPNAAKEYLESFLWLLLEFGDKNEINIPNLVKIMNYDGGKSIDGIYASKCGNAVDILFKYIYKKYPQSNASIKRRGYNDVLDARTTFACIKATVSSTLNGLTSNDTMEMLSRNDIDFNSFTERKTAWFISISDISDGSNRIVELFLTQMFQELYNIADSLETKAFPYHIMFLLDDAATYIGNIPNLENVLATGRSRNISITMALQSISQLERNGINATSIIDNCSRNVFYGSLSNDTNEFFARLSNMGYESIQQLDENDVLVIRSGKRAVIDQRFNINKHRTYHNEHNYERNI